MADIDTLLPELSKLIEERLAVVGRLAESLESSTVALVQNDAEAIARGAAHQAELCSQWSRLEGELRRVAGRGAVASAPAASSGDFLQAERSQKLEAEWESLGVRIRYVTRVHWSLLRHLKRSLAILDRVVDSCAPTYMRGPGLVGIAGERPAGEKSCRV